MDSGVGAGSDGVGSAARAGANIAHQLYSTGVSALSNGAKSATRELGEGPVATALKQAWRPGDEFVEQLAAVRNFHKGMVQQLADAVDSTTGHYRPRFAAALQGRAGEALLRAHDGNTQLWCSHQQRHEGAATAIDKALLHFTRCQGGIDNIAEDAQEQFDAAVRQRDPAKAGQVWAKANEDAEALSGEYTTKATGAIRAAKFDIPTTKQPDGSDGEANQNGPGQGDPQHKPGQNGAANPPATPDGLQTPVKGSDPGGAPTTSATPDAAAQTSVSPGAGAAPDGASQTPASTPPYQALTNQTPQALSGLLGKASSGAGGLGGSSGGGSPMSGLGSGLSGSGMQGMGSSMPTSAASSLPAAPSAAASPAGSAGLGGGAGSSFQAGLASGASSVAPPPVPQQPLPAQAVAAQQPLPPMAGSTPAGVPFSPAGGGDGGGFASGHGGGAASTGSGAPMMPPAAMGAGGPMAPYSAPGAGAGAAAGGAPTTPASGGQAGSAGAGGSSAGGGLTAPGAMVAGGSGSGMSAGAMGASSFDVNPDLLKAERVLAGLVRGSAPYPTLVAWAVSVLRTPDGSSQVVVASNVGDGGYVPETVFLPYTARLAVTDPMVPFGWGQRWMGNQHPAKALVDHFEHVSKRVAGVSMSALVTSDTFMTAPACAQDFRAVNHVAALNMSPEAPILDGAHQHRLTASDPALAHRVAALQRQAGDPTPVAWELTRAVVAAAEQHPEPGGELVTDEERNMLTAVYWNRENESSWRLYSDLLWQRDEGTFLVPESYGVEHVDGSPENLNAIAVYRPRYRANRIIELVQCWKNRPPSLADIVYCGVQAGFGSVVASTMAAVEEHLRRVGAPSS